jgi:hypothetical protein
MELQGSFGVRLSHRSSTMKCPHCLRLLDPKEAWKSSSSQFYCSEFCADSETVDLPRAAGSLMQYHLDGGYRERLERLLPYVRRHVPTQPA